MGRHLIDDHVTSKNTGQEVRRECVEVRHLPSGFIEMAEVAAARDHERSPVWRLRMHLNGDFATLHGILEIAIGKTCLGKCEIGYAKIDI
jgi:hypothetical protein